MNTLRNLAIGTAALAIASGSALADPAFLSTLLEPNHPITLNYHKVWADDIAAATDGEVSFEIFSGASLMPALSQMQGVADGLAQVAIHGAPYTPAELPVSNALGDMGFRLADEFVLAYAYTDFMMHEPVGYDEWRRNGVIFGGGFGNPVYYYLCRQDLSTLEDMAGKRVRTSGGGWARFSEAIGMTPVNIPSSEIYTGMERGALDCANADVTHLTSGATILDLTESVVMLPTSPAYISPGLIYNPAWWQGLTPDQRRIVFEATAHAMAQLQVAYAAKVDEVLAIAEEQGVKINQPSPELAAAREEWVANGIGGMADVARETYGIDDPEALYALFQTYIDKWQGLLGGIDRSDTAAVTALLQANLFDTLDPTTYGMD